MGPLQRHDNQGPLPTRTHLAHSCPGCGDPWVPTGLWGSTGGLWPLLGCCTPHTGPISKGAGRVTVPLPTPAVRTRAPPPATAPAGRLSGGGTALSFNSCKQTCKVETKGQNNSNEREKSPDKNRKEKESPARLNVPIPRPEGACADGQMPASPAGRQGLCRSSTASCKVRPQQSRPCDYFKKGQSMFSKGSRP